MMHSKGGRLALGFTLIELLVVIAIISLLAAILFPVFGRVRQLAHRNTCASNMRQLGLGMLQYSQDYDETYPKAFAYSNKFYGNAEAWDTQIQPYLGQKVAYLNRAALFQCPDDQFKRTSGYPRSYMMAASGTTLWPYISGATCTSGGGVGYLDKGFAGPTTADDDGYCYSRGRRASEIIAPAETLELVEMPGGNNVMSFGNQAAVMRPFSQFGKTNCGTNVTQASFCGQDGNVDEGAHQEGWNYLFADGHVKWLMPEKTIGTGGPYAPKGMWTIATGD